MLKTGNFFLYKFYLKKKKKAMERRKKEGGREAGRKRGRKAQKIYLAREVLSIKQFRQIQVKATEDMSFL